MRPQFITVLVFTAILTGSGCTKKEEVTPSQTKPTNPPSGSITGPSSTTGGLEETLQPGRHRAQRLLVPATVREREAGQAEQPKKERLDFGQAATSLCLPHLPQGDRK